MHRTRTTVAGLGAATALLLAGCGSQQAGVSPLSGTPHQQIQTAVRNLTSGDTLTSTLHLGANAKDLLTFAARVGGGGMNAKQAAALAGAELAFTVHSTQGSLRSAATATSSDLAKAEQIDLTFTDQGRRYAELREVNATLYLQADVQGIMTLLGAPANAYSKALQGAKQAPPFATDLLTGKWLALPLSQLKSVQNKLRQQAGPSAFPSPNAAQRRQFISGLQNVFSRNVTVHAKGDGTYTLTANVRSVVNSFLKTFVQLEPALSGRLGQLPMAQVPNRTITFGAKVSDNKLSRLSFDLAQLTARSGVPDLPLDLDFSTASTSVAAPTGATTVDLQQLLRSMFGASSSGSAVLKRGAVAYSSASAAPLATAG